MDTAYNMEEEYVHQLSKRLIVGWEAKLGPAGRIYYVNHHTQSSQWVPPKENWEANNDNGLPHGWERARDKQDNAYYINHNEETTQREQPANQIQEEPPPKPRDVELQRHPEMGFGFVAGSEKPVVVRFVTEDGPSEGKLLPGDCVLKINEEDVEQAPREHVIELVRSCQTTIQLTVCQPHSTNSGRKSALLTAAKKARLKNNPSRVRFADAVVLNGAAVISPSSHESYIPFMPNVLKVFLENGQTKSFKYDSKTCVRDVIDALQEKLNIQCIEHFALVLQNMKHPTYNKMTFLQEHEILAEIASRRGSQHFKCLFRLAFVPRDAFDLFKRDPAAFEYFYTQCTNDVVEGRYASELKYDMALRLAALHIQQHCLANNTTKVSLKLVERDTGFDKFLPESLLESVKIKDLRKMLTHFMKSNQSLILPGQKHLNAMQTKMHYLKVLSELRSFGGKCFLVTLEEKKAEVMVLVGPKQGLSLLTDYKNNLIAPLADFDQIENVAVVKRERETIKTVVLDLKDADMKRVSLAMLADEVNDFVCLTEGYYRVLVDKTRALLDEESAITASSVGKIVAPAYSGVHQVTRAKWSYARDSGADSAEEESTSADDTRGVDFSLGPPPYHPDKKYLQKIQQNSMNQEDEHLKISEINAPLASPEVSNLSEVIAPSSGTAKDETSLDVTQAEEASEDIYTDVINSSQLTAETSAESDLNSDTEDRQQEPVYANAHVRDSVPETAQDSDGYTADGYLQESDDELDEDEDSPKSDLLDSTLNSSFSDSLREGSMVDAVLDVLRTKSISRSESQETDTLTNDSDDIEKDKDLEKSEMNGLSGNDDEGTLSAVEQSAGVVLRRKPSGSTANDADSSLSTPTDSPAKVTLRPPSTTSRRRERPGSFGLHSPDKVPQTAAELAKLTTQFRELQIAQDLAQDGDEKIHPPYNPKLFCDGGLYLDPDIIDLTLIPPPETEGDEEEEDEQTDNLMDFSTPKMASPPAAFSDRNGNGAGDAHDTSTESEDLLPPGLTDLPPCIREKIDSLVANDEELGTQLAAIDALLIEDIGRDENEKESGIDSESDSGNDDVGFNKFSAKTPTCPEEVIRRRKKKPSPQDIVTQLSKRQSYQHVDFGANDIDAFIASVTVPPPPKEDIEDPQLLPSLPHPLRASAPVVSPKGAYGKLNSRFDSTAAKVDFGGVEVLDPAQVVGRDSWNEFLYNQANSPLEELLIEDEFAKYVIPPPESESNEIDLSAIPIVLPPSHTPTDSPRSMGSDETSSTVVVSPSKPSAKPKPASIKPKLTSMSLLAQKPTQKPPVIAESKPIKGTLPMKFQISKLKEKKVEHVDSARDSPVMDGPKKPPSPKTSSKKESPILNKGAIVKTTRRTSESSESSVSSMRSSSSGGVLSNPSPVSSPGVGASRPSVRPPASPQLSHRSDSSGEVEVKQEKRVAPPAPPKRHSSLDISEQPVSHRLKVDSDKVESRPQSAHLRPREAHSAESSPVRAPTKLAHSLGTLPRSKKRPPPPPPRRTSVLTTSAEMHELSRSVDNLQIQPPKFSTFGPQQGKSYKQMFGNRRGQAQSESNIFTMFRNSPMTTVSSSQANSSTPDSPNAPPKDAHVSPKLTRSPKVSNKIPAGRRTSSESSPEIASGVRGKHRQGSDSSDSVHASPRTRAKFVSPTIQAKQNAIASAFTHQVSQQSDVSSPGSPLPSSLRLTPRGEPPGSPSVGRSNTFTTASTIPRPYTSPKTSPALHRHSSFSKAADNSPAPFKTFLGDVPATKVTSSLNHSPRTSPREQPLTLHAPGSGTKAPPVKVVKPRVNTSFSQDHHTHSPHASGAQSPSSRHGESPRRGVPSTPRVSLESPRHRPASPGALRSSRPESPQLPPWKSDRSSIQGSSVSSPRGSYTGEVSPEISSPRRYFPARKAPALPTAPQHQQLQKAPSLPTFDSCAPPLNGSKPPLRRFNSIDATADFDLSDITHEVLARSYTGPNTFVQANMDVDSLVQFLNLKISNLQPTDSMLEQFTASKELLVAESRQFVTDSKMLVSSATQSHDQVVQRVHTSMHTLAKIVHHCVDTIVSLPSLSPGQELGNRVKDVAVSYKMTVNTAGAAAGKPLSDPNMKLLMKQATGLASILSVLMKTLKTVNYS